MTPVLETNRLELKPVLREHLASYKKHFVNYEVIRYLSGAVPWPYPDDGIEWFFNNVIAPNQGVDHWDWGLFLKEEPSELMGCINLWREERPEQRGFWLGEAFWGNGYMSEAAERVNQYAFEDLGFEQLVFANAVENIGSCRVKQKTGAKEIGVFEAKFVDPRFTMSQKWVLTKEDWKKRTS